MPTSKESTIRTCEELTHGDVIEAWQGGRLLHNGSASQTLPSMGMCWIVCARTGARKLVDLEAPEIIRVSAPTTRVRRDQKCRRPEYFEAHCRCRLTQHDLLADGAALQMRRPGPGSIC